MKDKLNPIGENIVVQENFNKSEIKKLEVTCISSKKILAPLCLFEAWINQFHKSKKIKYVALINFIFSVLSSLALGFCTYLLVVLYMYISLKGPSKDSVQIFYFSTFLSISLVYCVIFNVITFQNLFDETFNMPGKIKKLLLALFYDVKIENLITKSIITFLVYIIAFCALLFVIVMAFAPYEGSIITKNSQVNIIIFTAIIMSFIIIFFIQVYGINDLVKSSKRKSTIYFLSTIILITSTIGTLQKSTAGADYTKVFNLNFLSLIVTLIISVDRLLSNISTLIKEYDKINTYSLCESCLIAKRSYKTWIYKLKDYISKKWGKFKVLYKDFKKIPLKRRLLAFSLSIIIFIIFISTSLIERLLNLINDFSDKIFSYIRYWIATKLDFYNNNIYNYFVEILKYIVVLLLIIIGVMLIILIYQNIKSLVKHLKKRKEKGIDYELLYKKLLGLVTLSTITTVIFIILFSILRFSNLNLFVTIIMSLCVIFICFFLVLSFLFFIAFKLNKRNAQYLKDGKTYEDSDI